MDKEFYAEILPDEKKGELLLGLDENPRIRYVYLGDPVDSKIVSCINIGGGLLLIGLNNQKRINSLELNIARGYWQDLPDAQFRRPDPTLSGIVEFTNMNPIPVRTKCFDDLPLHIYTNQKLSGIKIEIGTFERASSAWLAISDNCLVELLDNYLVGFWIDFVE